MSLDPLHQLKRGGAKLRVLLVGVNRYHDRNLASLSYSVADCVGIEEALRKVTTQFPHCQIDTLYGVSDSSVNVQAFCDRLDQLLAGTVPKDTILFYFAGHGVLDSTSKELYLCLSETCLTHLSETAISMKRVLNRFSEVTAGKQVVILDACHSGGAFHSRGAIALENHATSSDSSAEFDPDFTPSLREALQDYTNQGYKQSKHFHALMSCDAGQQSYEMPNRQNGIFSYYLIQGIRGEAADEQGRIQVDRLSEYVGDHTTAYFRERQIPESRSQTPVHLKGASQKVILGFVEPQKASGRLESTGSGSTLLFRLDQYRHAVGEAFEQAYPLSEETWHLLKKFADDLYLPEEECQRIDSEIEQQVERTLAVYQQRATQRLHGSYPHEADPFIELRKEMGLKPEILKSYEEQAKQTFHQHEKQYRDAFLAALYEGGAISSDTRQQLQSLQQECGFAPAVIIQFETQETREFDRCKAEYQRLFFEAIHDNRVDQQALAQEQKRLGLGNTVVEQIEADITQLFETKKLEYRGRFAGSIRGATHPDLSPLKALQKNLVLSDALVEIIEAEEIQRLDRDRKKYREKLKSCLHQQVDFNVEEYHRRQQIEESIDLADVILDLLDQSAIEEFEQDCQTYRRDFSQKIRQEDPLRPQAKRQLQQLQESLSFSVLDRTVSNPVIERLQQQEQHQCHQDKQVYLQDYTQALRTQTPIHSDDQARLNARQQQFELSDQIIAQLISEVEQTFENDQKHYCQEFDWKLRNQSSLETEFVQQLQQKHNLSNVITQPLNAKLIADFERDQKQYHALLVRELNQKSSLTSVARQQLRKLQTERKLGDVVCQAIEAQVIARLDDERGRRNTYGQLFDRIIRQFNGLNDFVLEDHDRADLEQHRCDFKLTSQEVVEIEAQMLQQYQGDIQQYQTVLKQASYPLTDEAIEILESSRVNLNLSSQIAYRLEQQCLSEKLRQYEYAFSKTVIRHYPIGNKEQKQLRQLQQKLGLGDELILPIHQKVQAYVDEINKILETE
ncbi:caspase domain-containing protein [Leptolyngbyaceae cyanobacterium UHCC 1019]